MRSARRKTTGTPSRAAVPAGRQRMTIGELTRLRCPQPPRCTRHPLPQCGRGGTIAPAMVGEGSRGDELVPFADHIAVLVHDRIPHADPAHAVPERAAVAHRAGAFNLFAGRAEDVAFGRLASPTIATRPLDQPSSRMISSQSPRPSSGIRSIIQSRWGNSARQKPRSIGTVLPELSPASEVN